MNPVTLHLKAYFTANDRDHFQKNVLNLPYLKKHLNLPDLLHFLQSKSSASDFHHVSKDDN